MPLNWTKNVKNIMYKICFKMSFALPKIIVSSDAISLCFLRNVTIFCHHLFFAMPKRYYVDSLYFSPILGNLW